MELCWRAAAHKNAEKKRVRSRARCSSKFRPNVGQCCAIATPLLLLLPRIELHQAMAKFQRQIATNAFNQYHVVCSESRWNNRTSLYWALVHCSTRCEHRKYAQTRNDTKRKHFGECEGKATIVRISWYQKETHRALVHCIIYHKHECWARNEREPDRSDSFWTRE